MCALSTIVLVVGLAAGSPASDATLSTTALEPAATAPPQQPNIVFIMVDDWGWYDLAARRPLDDTTVLTPNLDALATGGLMLDHAYTASWCTPSRSAFISGRLPLHVFQTKTPSLTAWDKDHPERAGVGIPRNMTTLPRFLKDRGYSTHVTGKWDVGVATHRHTPEGRGFDSSFIYFNHCNQYWCSKDRFTNGCFNITDPITQLAYPLRCMTEKGSLETGWTDLWRDGAPHPEPLPYGVWEETLFGQRAQKVIAEHDPSAGSPLFLYYASHVAHAPLQVPDLYYDQFSEIEDEFTRTYHAMLLGLDDIIGNITSALKAKGMWENTLVVVSSDNGGPIYDCGHTPSLNSTLCGGANNYPLKGGKLSTWQGGIRVNAFVSGGFLPKERRGKTESGALHIADWLQTFCALAGGGECRDPAAVSAGLPDIDSVNMWPLLSGAVKTSPRMEYAITSTNDMMLLNFSSGHKLIVGPLIPFGVHTGPHFPNTSSPNGGSGFDGIIDGLVDCTNGCLFNIYDDPSEYTDLAKRSSMVNVMKTMRARLQVWQNDTFDPFRGSADPDACDAFNNKWGGFWGPWSE